MGQVDITTDLTVERLSAADDQAGFSLWLVAAFGNFLLRTLIEDAAHQCEQRLGAGVLLSVGQIEPIVEVGRVDPLVVLEDCLQLVERFDGFGLG